MVNSLNVHTAFVNKLLTFQMQGKPQFTVQATTTGGFNTEQVCFYYVYLRILINVLVI